MEGFIACEARAVNVLQAQADASPLVQALARRCTCLPNRPTHPCNARPFIQQALAHAHQASEREQRFVAAVAAWVDGDLPRAIALHEEQARPAPARPGVRSSWAIPPVQPRRLARPCCAGPASQPAAADVPYLHGMLAFGWEQCHRLKRSRNAAARHAIHLCRKEPWAHHALAHVMLTQGRISEGIDFMASVSDTWTGLNSFMVTHNWWRQALFLLEHRHAEVLALYDQQVWGVVKNTRRPDQRHLAARRGWNWRAWMWGRAGPMWPTTWPCAWPTMCCPFDLQIPLRPGPRRAHRGRTRAASITSPRTPPPAPRAHERTVWQVCVPTATACWPCAGRLGDSGGALGVALPRLVEIGGSHAQRDLFHQIWLDALQRNGQWAAVQNLLQPLCNAQPQSARLARQARQMNQALGLPDPAPQDFE